jgi:hypothetical protein
MDSGLALDETNNGFDPASRMLLTRADMAGFAAAAARRAPLFETPWGGTRWGAGRGS